MNELQIIERDGKFYTDSRQVAEMIGKQHAHLCRDIAGYIKVMSQNPKLDFDEFFKKSSYVAGTGKSYQCYLLTRKGCDMVANKLTGEKGILFTAEYVTRFDEMERTLKNNVPVSAEELFLQSAKLFAEHSREIKALKNVAAAQNDRIGEMEKTLRQFKELQELNADNWRIHCIPVLNRIAEAKDFPFLGGLNKYQAARRELYKRVDISGKCDLGKRLKNQRERALKQGASKTAVSKINKLDVISNDKILINIAIAELNKMAVQYGAVN